MKRIGDSNPQREQRRQQRLLAMMERRFRRILAAEIRRASDAMLAAYRATGRAPVLPDDHERRIADIYRQMAEVGIEAFGERIIGQGKHMSLILERKSFAEFFRRLALDYIGLEMIRRRITSVAETTRQQIVNQITRGQQAGEGIDEIAKRIAGNVGIISRQRGALIARTEVHGAANYGADGAARATGLKLRKEWVAAEDERTRPDHNEANGQIVDMDQAFDVGGEALMYPGDPAGSAGNIINCRCGVSHIVDDNADAFGVSADLTQTRPQPLVQIADAKNTEQLNSFVVASGVAQRSLISGGSAKVYANALASAQDITDRFGLSPLLGVGPASKFGYKKRLTNANAAIVSGVRVNRETGKPEKYAILHLPATFGKASEISKQHDVAKMMSERLKAEAAGKLAALGAKADPRVSAIMSSTGNAGYSWTHTTYVDVSKAARATINHEYGHVLHLASDVGPKIDKFLADQKPLAGGWDLVLSKYGGANEREYVAEAFSLYMDGDKSLWRRIHPDLLKIFREADKNDG